MTDQNPCREVEWNYEYRWDDASPDRIAEVRAAKLKIQQRIADEGVMSNNDTTSFNVLDFAPIVGYRVTMDSAHVSQPSRALHVPSAQTKKWDGVEAAYALHSPRYDVMCYCDIRITGRDVQWNSKIGGWAVRAQVTFRNVDASDDSTSGAWISLPSGATLGMVKDSFKSA
tara:strand:- start:3806 stop:4318 length:513 start_codon:yes stop_codon:yes gene_type:complete